MKYKSDLSKPFDEATAFLNDMETQLNTVCNGACRNYGPGLSLSPLSFFLLGDFCYDNFLFKSDASGKPLLFYLISEIEMIA